MDGSGVIFLLSAIKNACERRCLYGDPPLHLAKFISEGPLLGVKRLPSAIEVIPLPPQNKIFSTVAGAGHQAARFSVAMIGDANDGPETAQHALIESDFAPVAPHDVARDGKAKPCAFLVLVPCGVEAVEGAEHVLALVGGDAGAVIFDNDSEPAP